MSESIRCSKAFLIFRARPLHCQQRFPFLLQISDLRENCRIPESNAQELFVFTFRVLLLECFLPWRFSSLRESRGLSLYHIQRDVCVNRSRTVVHVRVHLALPLTHSLIASLSWQCVWHSFAIQFFLASFPWFIFLISLAAPIRSPRVEWFFFCTDHTDQLYYELARSTLALSNCPMAHSLPF